ncbi:hypothetical protein CO653_31010 [Rhizobium anhuiense]|nr:hypothetical protein CO653_31010 [Rhizobium anhuiense]
MKSIFANSFDAESAATAAIELFGNEAGTAVAYCALDAWTERRDDDYKFWVNVFSRLTGLPATSSTH